MPLAEYEIRDKIAVVTINNPPLNALDVPTKMAIRDVFWELDEKKDLIRAVVLKGGGEKAFAAGADIKAFLDLEPETAKKRLMKSHAVYSVVENFHWPVIAAIQGFCLGGGLELALCCDVRYAEENAVMGFPEVRLSIFPGNGGTARALHFLGLGRFKEMVYSGQNITAEQALQYGLVEKVVPEGESLEAALDLAGKIAKRGPLGVAAAKRAINRTRDLALHEALEVESDIWAGLSATHDMKEGAKAFIEKRKPVYKGK
ncbi:enoyl-CoA hydratase/isomerase family protein [Dethiosulfatarculus sandiegensis]|uniref:3-hydroxybutyryl-CoA dehydratase n=1 Tax=Dethiosulfatarculus sandiegensis TaxID=1429043 RepID=A0A0D2HN84_9BACT|nr:enoyl-CoA hydratase-related protein [Dethiosulfatarculus sandiegensis]KIX11998.1 3-hydroxybutyryl-CoA dehydratase [Dethiosulfatarculus sandiegensis]